MELVSESYVLEKKSKFYGFLYIVNSIDEVENILSNIRKEHKKCKHIVYAYKIGSYEKKYEDKEPSNTAGKPILDVIHFNNLDNTLIIVVRYFGGTLLGAGLLARTYSKAARELIKWTHIFSSWI